MRATSLRSPYSPVRKPSSDGALTLILEISKSELKDGITLIMLRGSIHTGPDCRRIEQEVEQLLQSKQTRAIFDFAGITHIDSAAIGVVVRCYSRIKNAGGTLRLAGCNGMVMSSLKLTKVDKVIEIFPDAAAASENFPAATPRA